MIKVQKDDFSLNEEVKNITINNNNIGGISTFTGIVRGGKTNTLKSITLEHYSGMTEKMLKKIDFEAQKRWNLIATKIIHRYGRLLPGDQIVLVITASEHRKDAIEYVLDKSKDNAVNIKNIGYISLYYNQNPLIYVTTPVMVCLFGLDKKRVEDIPVDKYYEIKRDKIFFDRAVKNLLEDPYQLLIDA